VVVVVDLARLVVVNLGAQELLIQLLEPLLLTLLEELGQVLHLDQVLLVQQILATEELAGGTLIPAPTEVLVL
jgi:hypothetical protein